MPCVLSRRKYRQVNPILVATVILPLITAKGAGLQRKELSSGNLSRMRRVFFPNAAQQGCARDCRQALWVNNKPKALAR